MEQIEKKDLLKIQNVGNQTVGNFLRRHDGMIISALLGIGLFFSLSGEVIGWLNALLCFVCIALAGVITRLLTMLIDRKIFKAKTLVASGYEIMMLVVFMVATCFLGVYFLF